MAALQQCLSQCTQPDMPFSHPPSAACVRSRRHAVITSNFVSYWMVPAPTSCLELRLVKAEASVALETRPTDEEEFLAPANAEALDTAAVKAAKCVASLQGASVAEFPSEVDFLRLQRARLSDLEVKLFQYNRELRTALSKDEAGILELEQQSTSKMCNPSEGSTCLQEKTEVYTRKGQAVAVRSQRRTERLISRKRARAKAEKVSVAAQSAAASAKQTKLHKMPRHDAPTDHIQSFLVNNGSIDSKLLTAAEEVELSHKVQDLIELEAVKTNLRMQLGREPSLSEWGKAVHMEIRAFSDRLLDAQQSKDRMLQCNLRLVISVAKKYSGKGLSVYDLIQEGTMGLIRGCKKFDASRGYKFSTYAHWWIRQAVTRAISDKSRTIRLPANQYGLLCQIRKARRALYAEHGHFAGDADVAERLGIGLEKLKTATKAVKGCRSLEKPVGKDLNMCLVDIIPDANSEPPESVVGRQLLKHDLDEVLGTLHHREEAVVRLRYGLEDGRCRSLEEIGKMFRVTRERIRQIEAKAMTKLKEPERVEVLRGSWLV